MPEFPLGASIRVVNKLENVSLLKEFVFLCEREVINKHIKN